MSQLSSVNTSTTLSNPPPKSFTLSSPPKTDIYAAPAHGYVWSAPIIHHTLPASKFKRARVTITLNWTTTYDQGGLILAFPSPSNLLPNKENARTKASHPLWVKAGIEMNNGKAFISSVAREQWADWTLSPPSSSSLSNEGKTVKATIEFEKHENALCVFVYDGEGGEKIMTREVQWVFLNEEREGGRLGEMWVGIYVCRPDAKDEMGGRALEVGFEEFIVETV
jgi:regulation of enolase protein 1 (concanavalin A-like superfamily)